MRAILMLILLSLSIKASCGFDENEVYCYIKSIGIKNPEIVLKQAIYETGHFKSANCKKKKNLFGFRSTLIYKSFDTWQQCVDYYKKWQDRHYKDDSEDYYHFLQRINYSGHKGFDYATELKRVHIVASLNCSNSEK
jgi:hypothetical protein